MWVGTSVAQKQMCQIWEGSCLISLSCFLHRIGYNVRRYVHVGAESRWRVFLHSRCDARLSGYYIILALAKTVTPGGSPRREPGRPAPPLKVFHFDQRILAVQKPIAYTDLLGNVLFYFSLFFQFHHFNRAGSCFSFSA